MSFLSTLSGIAKVVGGLGGLFKKDKPPPTAAQQIMSQAQGARDAAAATGFNPLTLLGVPTTSFANSGTPPLASLEALTGGLDDLDGILSGRKAQENAARRLQLELSQLELETAKANLGLLRTPSAVGRVAAAPGSVGLGVKPTTAPNGVAVPIGAGTFGPLSFGSATAKHPVTSYTLLGYDIEADPRNDDSETVEKRAGEIGAEAAGVANIVGDIQYTYGPTIQKWRDRYDFAVNAAVPWNRGARLVADLGLKWDKARDEYEANGPKPLPQWGAGVADREYPPFFNKALR